MRAAHTPAIDTETKRTVSEIFVLNFNFVSFVSFWLILLYHMISSHRHERYDAIPTNGDCDGTRDNVTRAIGRSV